jgi:Ca2+-binding EF-hand superfamily protein
VDLLYTAFRQIDLSADGMVSLGEFYDYFECPKTPFTDMLFKVLDQDKSGDIDFKEFSIILWNYLSYDFKTLAAFTFSLWDTDKSQVLEKQEIIEMVTAVYGATRFAQNRRLEDVMKHLGLDGDGDVTLKEFQWMCRRYPLLIHPAHATQRMLRERVVSERYWHKLTRRRRKLFKDCTDIWDILSDDIAWGAEAASALPGGQKAAKIVRTHVPASLAQYFSNEDWGRYTSADAYATDVRDTVKNLDVEAVQKDAKVEQIKAMKSALAAEDGVGKMDEWQVTLLDETRKEFGGEVPDDLIVLPEMDVRAEMRRKGSEIGHFTAKDLKRSLDTAHDDDLTVVELDED